MLHVRDTYITNSQGGESEEDPTGKADPLFPQCLYQGPHKSSHNTDYMVFRQQQGQGGPSPLHGHFSKSASLKINTGDNGVNSPLISVR